MKVEKNKIVFGSVVGLIVLFMVFYSMSLMGEDEPSANLQQTFIPSIEDEKIEYDSKLEAVDDIKKERKRFIQPVYDETKLDENGYFIEDKEQKDKQKIIDSIYNEGQIKYDIKPNSAQQTKAEKVNNTGKRSNSSRQRISYTSKGNLDPDEVKKEHDDFFSANNTKTSDKESEETLGPTDPIIYAEVDGDQVLKNRNRLEMRLTKDAIINGFLFKKNTYVYGNTAFKPNRIMIDISSINNKPVNVEAYDQQDGGLGIYVENSLTAEASSEVASDLSNDINLPIPGVRTVSRLFRKKVKNIKVTVINKYQLLLKPKQ